MTGTTPQTAAPSLAMLLATDLDGTFLAGKPALRRQLYRMIKAHPEIQMVWVTGRGLETVLPLLSDPTLPYPDFLICDVGATVVSVSTMQAVQPLQLEIESLWPGEQAVAQMMAKFDGLIRQDVPQQRRCSGTTRALLRTPNCLGRQDYGTTPASFLVVLHVLYVILIASVMPLVVISYTASFSPTE
ncbi:MAG: Sucrose-6F-phosphate phosphohydrolase [Betaproteobacteria bacterium ADurb.Bin341]|nr:MAG: Sucrose-6F-phosphate phosphohydrolase [Betaproteobacteria bacterium ADurb.Bin341]